jgi:tetratricopeptide (TPR) repeat protein
MMNSMRFGIILALAAPILVLCQQPPIAVPGVDEPPELSGPGKKFTAPPATVLEFGKIVQNWKENDTKTIAEARAALSHFLEDHPTFSPAYTMRAMGDFCFLASKEYDSISNDVQGAFNTFTPEVGVFSQSDLLALRGKVRFDAGRYKDALDDLESAMKAKLDSADSIFGSGDTKPETTNTNPCIWTMSNLDTFAQKFPKDYRVPLLRGLYIKFFATFDEKLYQPAIQELQKAALLNPRSPLPHYVLGELYFKASFLTKAAWASDEGRTDPIRKAVAAYSRAIQLDPGFSPAYEMRASCYEQQKQYLLAIADYDKVLELDKDNVTAFADRGLAELEMGRYFAATSDLGEAIRRKGEDGNPLSVSMSYEYRADAYTNLGMYQDAIQNYSQAIKYKLANITFLITLHQFRGLYPEYNKVSDEVLIRKINVLFWPQYDYATMSKQLLEKESEWKISMINDLYEKRGDCYLRSGDYRRGVLDFTRIFKGIPDFAGTVERWRLLGGKVGEEWYVDVKSTEFAETPRLWTKFLQKDKGFNIQSFDFDCKERRIAVASTAVYDKEGKILHSDEANSGWQRVIPESRGEQMFEGMCGGR